MATSQRVTYREVEPEEALSAEFVVVTAEPERGAPHEFLCPRAWLRVPSFPVDDSPDAPLVDALVVEHPSLGNEAAVIVCGRLPPTWAVSAREAVVRLAAREKLEVERWNDEDDAVGGARALARSASRLAALRVLPHEGGQVFCSVLGPTARFGAFGGALQNAITSYRPLPSWASGS